MRIKRRPGAKKKAEDDDNKDDGSMTFRGWPMGLPWTGRRRGLPEPVFKLLQQTPKAKPKTDAKKIPCKARPSEPSQPPKAKQ